MKTVRIYGLKDGEEIRYVGKTARTPEARLREHLHPSKLASDTYKNKWLRRAIAEGRVPTITLLEEVDASQSNWEWREVVWIFFGLHSGWRLTNATGGGPGLMSFRHSDSTKRKIAEKKIGKPCHRKISQEEIAATIARNKSRVWSEESRKKASMAKIGKRLPPRTEEQRQRYREANIGNNVGRIHTPETKAKMSAAVKARWLAGKFSNRPSRIGRMPPFTESRLANMRIAQQRRRDRVARMAEALIAG